MEDELRLHAAYAAQWGVVVTRACPPGPATLAYTGWLLDVAAGGSPVRTLAAMAPCSRLYGFLGCALAAAGRGAGGGGPYFEWVDTYSSDGYLQAPEAKEGLLDRLAVGECQGEERMEEEREAGSAGQAHTAAATAAAPLATALSGASTPPGAAPPGNAQSP